MGRVDTHVLEKILDQTRSASEQQSPAGLFYSDVSGHLTWASPAWFTCFGDLSDEANDGVWEEAIHPFDRTRVLAAWKGAVAARRSYNEEYRVNSPRLRWVRSMAAPKYGPNWEFLGHTGVVIDITESRVALETSRKEAAFYNALFGAVPAPCAVVRADGTRVAASRVFAEHVGRSQEWLIGRKVWDIVAEESREQAHDAFMNFVRTEAESMSAKRRIVGADGLERHYWLEARRIWFAGEAYFIGMFCPILSNLDAMPSIC